MSEREGGGQEKEGHSPSTCIMVAIIIIFAAE